jgi:predicted alpha/beta superfamily hydrolase
MIWLPPGDPPATGFPTIYVLDGGQNFGLFTDLGDWLAARARHAGKDPALVVAVGYPRGDYTLDKRIYDLTPTPAPGYRMPERPNGTPWPELGGGDAFLDMIETEVKPMIRADYAGDPARETLYGHSFGGMMALHALVTRPESYSAYVASSPSLWFNGGQVMDAVRGFLAQAASPTASPIRLLLSVGGDEQVMTGWDSELPDPAAYAVWKLDNRMVDNARDLAAMIQQDAAGRIALTFQVLPGEDHGSVRPISAYRAIVFAIDG